jgi:hypothetical protein
MQGFTQGQTEQVAMETNQLKLQELKRDRDEMMQLQEQLKGMGQDPDLDKFLDAYIATGRPEYVKMGVEGKQKLKEQRAYANLIGGAAPPAPTNAMAQPAPVAAPAAFGAELGTGMYGMAPTNAMARPAPAAAAPVNALAQPAVAETRKRISDLMTFAAQNPNMASQAMAQARLLQDQLEMDSRRGPNEPPDVATMRQLGYPTTPAGYEAYRNAQRQERMLSPAEEAQRVRIAAASRAPVQPKEPPPPTAPVAVVDDATGQIKYVTREEALGKTPATAIEGLTPKERQTREAKYPQATSAVKTFENTSDTLVTDLEKLAKHPGLSSITGIAAGRLPGITKEGREAEALFDKIVARGGFQELQTMRQASPTGGALGNVSNQEGAQLRQAFAALDRRQDAPSVRNAITDAIAQIRAAKENIRGAYDLTYEYKQQTAAPAKPTMSPVDKQALDWANSNPNDPRAAAIKQRLGM